jgi:hypothetical protein
MMFLTLPDIIGILKVGSPTYFVYDFSRFIVSVLQHLSVHLCPNFDETEHPATVQEDLFRLPKDADRDLCCGRLCSRNDHRSHIHLRTYVQAGSRLLGRHPPANSQVH